MLKLSTDTKLAHEQMNGLIYYLTAIGSIDGELDPKEMSWVLQTIRKLVEQRVDHANVESSLREKVMQDMINEWEQVFDSARREVARLLTESVEQGESQEAFVTSKLKQRCFEILMSFDPEQQLELITAADDLLLSDGTVHPAEIRFRDELTELLQEPIEELFLPEQVIRTSLVREHQSLRHEPFDHPIFTAVEEHYSTDETLLSRQLEDDRTLIHKMLHILEVQRSQGQSRLSGIGKVDDLKRGVTFLDGFVSVIQPDVSDRTEVIALGDLHGCYSNFKAALIQSRFLQKVENYRAAPERFPNPKLILLGDYIDRGHYGFEGTLRLALFLFTNYPEHVIMLRGNHEFWVEYEGDVVSTVQPAETLARLRPWGPLSHFRDYTLLFNSLPCMALLGRVLFVHGGIPMDSVTRTHLSGLSGLNEWEMIFQMLWSDPSTVDVMPKKLQESSLRFAYGRLQALSFLQQIGCHTIIRGHEHIESGSRINFDDERMLVLTLFSAGGESNTDLPDDADLHLASPRALTLRMTGGRDATVEIHLWPIDFKRYNSPETNGFYARKPEIPL